MPEVATQPLASREYVACLKSARIHQESRVTAEIDVLLYDQQLRQQGSATLPLPPELYALLEGMARDRILRSNLRLTLSILPA